jgi:molecular chaperone HtpG
VLKALEEMKRDAAETYSVFFRELGTILKEGLVRDSEHREALSELLLFESLKTAPGSTTTLGEYVTKMPEEQKEIWTLSGENRAATENAPVLEVFKEKGWDVLLLTDPIDEFAIPQLREYKGKALKAADRDELPEAVKPEGYVPDEAPFRGLFDSLASVLDGVKEIRLSRRLRESAACLVAPEGEMGANMERILKRSGHAAEVGEGKRVLELNGGHAAVEALRSLHERAPGDPRLAEYGRLLYEEAVLAEGSKVKDPVAMAKRINELLVRDAAR